MPDSVDDHIFCLWHELFESLECVFLYVQGCGKQQRFQLAMWKSALFPVVYHDDGGIAEDIKLKDGS